jgi:hypothetical protein
MCKTYFFCSHTPEGREHIDCGLMGRHCAVLQVVSDVSEEPASFNLRVGVQTGCE